VTTNSIVCGYLALSLVLSFFHIVRTISVKSRILLVFLDTVNTLLLLLFSSHRLLVPKLYICLVNGQGEIVIIKITLVMSNDHLRIVFVMISLESFKITMLNSYH